MGELGEGAGLDSPTVDVVVRQGAHVIVPQATQTHNCPSNSAERGHAIATDDAGNVLVVLYELAPSGSMTFRLRRLDPDGATSWARTISDIPGSAPIALRVARTGDVVTAPRSLAALGR